MLITHASLEALRVTLNKDFFAGLESPTSPVLELARELPSTTNINTYSFFGAFPKFREWIGPRHFQSLTERKFDIRNKTYEGSILVEREKVEDNDIVEARDIAMRLGARGGLLKQDLVTDLIKNGHQAKCYDGQNFFDTDHPINLDDVTGTQQNYWASGMPLTEDNLDTVWTAMSTYVGEDGENLGIMATHLIVPPQLRKKGIEITTSDFVPDGAGGTKSNPMKGTLGVMVIPKLATEPTAWYVASLSLLGKPFIVQNRRAVAVTSRFSPTDDNVFLRNQFEFGADARLGAGYGPWQFMAKAKA